MEDIQESSKSAENGKCAVSADDVIVEYEIFCEYCGLSFTTIDDHATHLKDQHGIEGNEDSSEVSINLFPCSQPFLDKAVLAKHRTKCKTGNIATAFGNKTNVNNRTVLTVSSQENSKKLEKSTHTFKCQFCDSHFTDRTALENHVDKGHELIPPDKYDCHLCKKTFLKAESLQLHLNVHHHFLDSEEADKNSDGFYSCPFCDKMKIPWFKILKLHIERVHSDYTEEVCKEDVEITQADVNAEKPVTDAINTGTNNELKSSDEQSKNLKQFQYVCPKCEFTAKKVRFLKLHIMNNKKHENQFTKSVLEKLNFDLLRFEAVGESISLDTANNEYFKCPYCWFISHHKAYVEHHMRVRHRVNTVVQVETIALEEADKVAEVTEDCVRYLFIKCPHCGLYVTAGMERHVENAHSDKAKTESGTYTPVEMVVKYVAAEETYSEMDTGTPIKLVTGAEDDDDGGIIRKNRRRAAFTSTSPVNCPYCPSVLSAISHLKRHVVRHHLGRIATTNKKDGTVTKEANRCAKTFQDNQKFPKPCIVCQEIFPTAIALHGHLLSHKDTVCYLCDFCDLAFTKVLHLVMHMPQHQQEGSVTHDGSHVKVKDESGKQRNRRADTELLTALGTALTCPYCPSVLNTLNLLSCHVVSHHLDRLGTTKKIKGKTNVLGIGEVMENTETGIEPDDRSLKKCIVCPEIFSDNDDLHAHLLMHKAAIYHSCALCGIYFKKLLDLVDHMSDHRENHVTSGGDISGAEALDKDGDMVVTNKGDGAGMKENSRRRQGKVGQTIRDVRLSDSKRKKRKNSHFPESGTDIKKRKTTAEKADSDRKDSKVVKTVLVNSFVSPTSRSRHAEEMSEVNKCPHCEFTCKRQSALKFHMNMNHPGLPMPAVETTKVKQEPMEVEDDNLNEDIPDPVQSHACNICNLGYKTNKSLTQHMKVAHLDERKFQCGHCDKRFTFHAQLVFHEAIHGEKSVSCTVDGCKKKFSCQRYLRDHLRAVHGMLVPKRDMGNQIHTCEACRMTFTDLTALQAHSDTHKDLSASGDEKRGTSQRNEEQTDDDVDEAPTTKSVTIRQPRVVRTDAQTGKGTQSGSRKASHNRWRNRAIHQCGYCGNRYRSLPALKFHMREVHDNEELPHNSVGTMPFSSPGKLTSRQKESHLNEKPFICEACGNRFLNRKDLVRHKARVHNVVVKRERRRVGLLHCAECGSVYNSSTALKYHVRQTHGGTERPHKCEHCAKAYWHPGELADHISSFHLRQKPFICEECGKGFTTRKGLKLHIERHRQSHVTEEAAAVDEATAAVPDVVCHLCGLGMPPKNSSRALHSHIRKVHSETVTCACDICSTVYDENQPAVENIKAVCPECKQCFCQKYFLEAHMVAAHPQFGKHECKFCTIKFSTKKLLSHHIHRDHKLSENVPDNTASSDSVVRNADFSLLDDTATVDELDLETTTPVIQIGLDNMPRYLPKLSDGSLSAVIKELRVQNDDPATSGALPFKCLLCGRCFRLAKYVNVHIRSWHVKNEDQPYRCKICSAGFESLPRFRKHARTHSNFRPFKCGVCNKGFKQSEHLKEHELIHTYGHTIQCVLCKRMFKQRGALTGHLLSHDKLKPFNCQFCDRGFSDRGQLSRHMKQYLKVMEKGTHMCHICSETFTHFPLLMTHIATHNPAKPFLCGACPEAFRSFVQMYFHKLKQDHFTTDDFEGIEQVTEEAAEHAIENTGEFQTLRFQDGEIIEGEQIMVEQLTEAASAMMVDESKSATFHMEQGHLSMLNSHPEVVIETVGFENEGTVYSVPEGRTSDEILSIAKQLTELSGYTKIPIKNSNWDSEKIESNAQEQEIILRILDVDDDKLDTLEKLKNGLPLKQEVQETPDTQEAEIPTEIIINEDNTITNQLEVDHEVETETTLYDESQYGEHVTIVVSSYCDEQQLSSEELQGTVVQVLDGMEYVEIPTTDSDIVEAVRALNSGQATTKIELSEPYTLEEQPMNIEETSVMDQSLQVPEPAAADLAIVNTTTFAEEFPPKKPLLEDLEAWTGETGNQQLMMDIEVRETPDGRVTCSICGTQLKGRKQLKEHVLRHQGSSQRIFACEYPGCSRQFYNGAELRRHSYIHMSYEQRPHQCATCAKRFLQAGHLRSHELLHTGEKPFSCPQLGCDARFVTRTQLKTHFVSSHVNEKHICCSICNESFKDRAAFTRHIGMKHSAFFENSENSTPDTTPGATPCGTPKRSQPAYVCEQCGAELSSKITLEDHMNKHLDTKPYVCDACGASYRTLRHLNNHITSAHDEEDRMKPKTRKRKKTTATKSAASPEFICPSCNRIFRARHSLAYHLGANEKCRLTVPLPDIVKVEESA